MLLFLLCRCRRAFLGFLRRITSDDNCRPECSAICNEEKHSCNCYPVSCSQQSLSRCQFPIFILILIHL